MNLCFENPRKQPRAHETHHPLQTIVRPTKHQFLFNLLKFADQSMRIFTNNKSPLTKFFPMQRPLRTIDSQLHVSHGFARLHTPSLPWRLTAFMMALVLTRSCTCRETVSTSTPALSSTSIVFRPGFPVQTSCGDKCGS